ncbi:MAG TPA: hypothetical protein DDW52_06110 [Planctomycetaceae bacterium]|nr:hypothetical protein [Planctomycetaceae bacterium]
MIRLALCLCLLFALGCGGDNTVSAPENTTERPDDLMVSGDSDSTSSDDGNNDAENMTLK